MVSDSATKLATQQSIKAYIDSKIIEGYHTPTVTCSTSGNYTLDASQDTFAYTKIGRDVHVQGSIHISGENAPNGDLIVSLPYAVTNLTEAADLAVGVGKLINHGGDIPNSYCAAVASTSTLKLYKLTDAGVNTIITHTDVDTDFYIAIGLTYISE